jgi:hypothetical protein
MAIFHSSLQVISRGQGKSCVAAAAYRAGEKLYDERQELNHDYSKKQGVESEIMAPANSPEWVYDRQKLWNEVDQAETRCNSRTARELNIALPVELSKDQQKELVREYVKENFVNKGMVADVCFHFNDEHNPHFHVMLTTREITQEGFTKKNREWDKKENATIWREHWAKQANKALEKAGCEERIDHRSYREQGIDQVPTIHLGKTSSEMQKKGLDNPRAEINRQIKELNKEKVVALQEYRELKAQLEQRKAKEAQRYSHLKPEEKAVVVSSEKLIGQPLNYENAKESLRRLEDGRKEHSLKLSKINFELGESRNRSNSITFALNALKRAENEFKDLPKNIFGKYKDKERAESLNETIRKYKEDLLKSGYKSSIDLEKNKTKVADLEKSMADINEKIKSIDTATRTIHAAVKALQNKELREFYQEYKAHFPQARYLQYDDMKAIKAASEILGRPVSFGEVKDSYKKQGGRVESIDKKIQEIEENGRRLTHAKQCLETIDKYQEIAEKWDTKLFGKAKFQEAHRAEKWHYDKAVENLKEYKVRDKADLRLQESNHDQSLKQVMPKLQAERETIVPTMKILGYALQGLERALRAEKYAQRQNDLQLTKAYKSRGQELER